MLAGAWTGLIYATLYIVRPVCTFLKTFVWFSSGINVVMVLLVFGVIVVLVRKRYLKRTSTYLLLTVVVALYLAGMAALSIPEERLHLIEYGVLVILVYRAVAVDRDNAWTYALALVITFLIGWGDEGIQHLLPNRYYQFKDVCLNGASAALGLALVYVVRREKGAG